MNIKKSTVCYYLLFLGTLLILLILVKKYFTTTTTTITTTVSPVSLPLPNNSNEQAHHALGLYWIRLEDREKIFTPNTSWILEHASVFNNSVYFLEVRMFSIKNSIKLPYPEDMDDDVIMFYFTLYPHKKQLYLDDYHITHSSPIAIFFYQMMKKKRLFDRNQFLNY